MVMPKDLERGLLQFDGAGDGDGGLSSCASDDEMENYEGDPLSSGDEVEVPPPQPPDEPASSAAGTHAGPRFKQFHLSPEWIALKEKGAHLVNVPPIVGCGINRHPAKSFWSCRFPGHGEKTATWNATRSPLKCLVLCLRHLIQVYVDTVHPADADQWNAQLDGLSQVLL